jgi:hypothetical protein
MKQHNQNRLLVFLSSPTLSLTLGQANSAEGEVLVQSHSSLLDLWFGPVEKPLHLLVDCCVADTLFADPVLVA